MFPRNYVVVVDEQNRLIDFRLYENDQDARRAYQSWVARDGGYEWRLTQQESIFYKRSDLRIAIGLLPFQTFHSMSDDQMRAEARGFLHYEVMVAAKDYERRSLLNREHRKTYYRKKYRYLLSALVPIALVSIIIFYLRGHYVVDPLPNLSLSISVIGFSAVAYFLHKEFGSWIGALLGAAAGWVVWGIVASVIWSHLVTEFTPLFGW